MEEMNFFEKIVNWLKGKKTYIVVIVGVLVNGMIAMEIIPRESFVTVNAILGFLGLGTIRAGIKSAEKR